MNYTNYEKRKIYNGIMNREKTKWYFSGKYDEWLVNQYKKLNNFKYNIQVKFFLKEDWDNLLKIEKQIEKIENEIKDKQDFLGVLLDIKIKYKHLA